MLTETGKGGFTVRDIQRLAAAHDFTWSEKEIADMICYFDGDGDGKVVTFYLLCSIKIFRFILSIEYK